MARFKLLLELVQINNEAELLNFCHTLSLCAIGPKNVAAAGGQRTTFLQVPLKIQSEKVKKGKSMNKEETKPFQSRHPSAAFCD